VIRLNVGSGQRPFQKPWTNVDINPKWSPDVVADGAHMPMFESNSADMIVLHHCAEHMTLDGSKAAFREANRILDVGGSLLVFVPDLRTIVAAWTTGRIDDYIFCVNLHGAYNGDEADIHRWSFTYHTLRTHVTNSAEWRSASPFDWRPIEGADIAKDWWILGMEAIK